MAVSLEKMTSRTEESDNTTWQSNGAHQEKPLVTLKGRSNVFVGLSFDP